MNFKKSKEIKIALLFFVIYFVLSMGYGMVTNGGVSIITLVLVIVAFLAAAAVYFIPSIVARRKKHTQITAITLLNIF